jgi:hypothetical protein
MNPYRFDRNSTARAAARRARFTQHLRSFEVAHTRARLERRSLARRWPARPQDAERLAALDQWAALYASDGSSPEQAAAAKTSARASREISSIQRRETEIMAGVAKRLAALARMERVWQRLKQSANAYLERAVDAY